MLFNAIAGLVASSTPTPVAVDWTSIVNANSFDGMMTGINSALPIVVPVGLTILGLGIVWRLIKKFAK